MRSRLENRLQRLEQAAKRRHPIRENPELNADLRCLGRLELRRAVDALKAPDDARKTEAISLLERARARRLQGWSQADGAALDKQDQDKIDAVWRFRDAFGRRHRLYPDVYRFDVMDLIEAEIKQLVEVAEKAKCASDLEAVAELVGRFRLDGRVMDMAAFEALVLRGEITKVA